MTQDEYYPEATREAWLLRAVDELRPLLKQAGAQVPKDVLVSVGFPVGVRGKGRAIGQCWQTKTSGGINQLFVSPELHAIDEVLATLLHELIHASDDCASKHAGHFRRVATTLGFQAPFTQSHPDVSLSGTLKEIGAELGPYPHKKLTRTVQVAKQTTRLLKLQCCSCECTIRTTNKWLQEYGSSWPCPCQNGNLDVT